MEPDKRQTVDVDVRIQSAVLVGEIPLIQHDQHAMRAIRPLRERGYSPEDMLRAMQLQPIPTTRVPERQARRASLRFGDTVKTRPNESRVYPARVAEVDLG